jgi:hypothetical protein
MCCRAREDGGWGRAASERETRRSNDNALFGHDRASDTVESTRWECVKFKPLLPDPPRSRAWSEVPELNACNIHSSPGSSSAHLKSHIHKSGVGHAERTPRRASQASERPPWPAGLASHTPRRMAGQGGPARIGRPTRCGAPWSSSGFSAASPSLGAQECKPTERRRRATERLTRWPA